MNREPSPREKEQNDILRVGKMFARKLEDKGIDSTTLEAATLDAVTIEAITTVIKQRHQKPTEE